MANTNLAIRFTDETYATRAEVAKALGTNLIDNIWYNVLSYRAENSNQLSLIDVAKKPFTLTQTEVIKQKYLRFDARFNEVYKRYIEFESTFEKNVLKKDMIKMELKYVARAKGIAVNDIAIENIINGVDVNPLYNQLIYYYNAISHFDQLRENDVNEELLAEYLNILSGGYGLTTFYRQDEFKVIGQKALIGREYMGAPVYRIEEMMSDLLNYLVNTRDGVTVKLAAISYMFNYIKPFDKYNDEIAIFVSKHVLAKHTISDVALYIPLELVMCEDIQGFATASRETQKFNDLTYYVNQIAKLYEEAIRNFMDRSFLIKRNEAEDAYYNQPEQAEAPQQTYSQPNFGPLPTNRVVQPQSQVQQPQQRPVYAQPSQPQVTRPVEQKPVYQQSQPRVVQPQSQVQQPQQRQVYVQPTQRVVQPQQPKPQSFIPSTNESKVDVSRYQDLDEKALNRAAEDLLHKDPTLSKKQAHFYVRHCTPGYSYSIQDFKKCERCVYETARTSMDDLARGGYYRREQLKNKFIYIVISK